MGRASDFNPSVLGRRQEENNAQNDRMDENIFCEDNYVRTKRFIMQIEESNSAIVDIWRLSSRLFDINQEIERMVLNLKAHYKILDTAIKKAKIYYLESKIPPGDTLQDMIALEFRRANQNYQVFAKLTSASIKELHKKLHFIRKSAMLYARNCEETFNDVCDGCSVQSTSNCFYYSYAEFVKVLFELSFCKSEALDCIAKSERYLLSLQAVLEMMR